MDNVYYNLYVLHFSFLLCPDYGILIGRRVEAATVVKSTGCSIIFTKLRRIYWIIHMDPSFSSHRKLHVPSRRIVILYRLLNSYIGSVKFILSRDCFHLSIHFPSPTNTIGWSRSGESKHYLGSSKCDSFPGKIVLKGKQSQTVCIVQRTQMIQLHAPRPIQERRLCWYCRCRSHAQEVTAEKVNSNINMERPAGDKIWGCMHPVWILWPSRFGDYHSCDDDFV